MKRKESLKIGLVGTGLAAIIGLIALKGSSELPSAQKEREVKPWNFVFILADDMGWNQVGYLNSNFYETPILDSLARSGIYFTNAYAAAPTCSPSRASILTGKYPARLHLTEYIPGDPYPWARLQTPKMTDRLPLEEVTIAELVKPAGYVTAMVGKWHLNSDKNYQPGRLGDAGSQGFDLDYPNDKPEDDADPTKDAHHTVENTEVALQFIEHNKDKPFLLYLAYHTPHRPIMEDPDLIYKYQIKLNSDLPTNNPIMGAMIERMDTQIGRILKKLDDLRLASRTIVIFTSDNGGYDKLQAQGPLRGGKSMLYEGGIRVPLIIKWPGVVKPNSRCGVPVSGIDFFPTIAEICGIKTLPRDIDGVSLVAVLKQQGTLKREALYWHYPHYHRFSYRPSGAIRMGRYKLIEWYERSLMKLDHQVSLFDLEEDIGEQHDLADKMPAKAKELLEKLRVWRQAVGAQEMVLNPNFDSKKALFWKEEVNPKHPNALGQYY
jgi:arylsulfatase A-like enzyme